MKLIYIGNKLSEHGNTPTSIEILAPLLSEDFQVSSVSNKKNKVLRLIDMLWTIVKYRKQTDFILIDTYSTSNFYYALFCSGLAYFFRIRYIPILHGGNLPDRLLRNPKMTTFIFENAYINVAPSGYLFEVFKVHGFRAKLIPNNIEVANYRFTKREKLRPKLLYVRAFSSIYNPELALKVLKKLLVNYPNAELCMVGPDRDGTLEKTKEKCREMELDGKVQFTGKLDKKDWWELSKEYDIFLNTTNFDNMPTSLIEAMALGLPIVTTNVGGIPYLVENKVDGLVVPANDSDAMCKQVEFLLSNPQKALQITLNARQKAESFDWYTGIRQLWLNLLKKENK